MSVYDIPACEGTLRVTSILQKTAIFGAMGLALSIIPAASASASNSTASSAAGQRELSGGCEDDDFDNDYYGDVRVFYTPRNGFDQVEEIQYYLGTKDGKTIGKKNNVRLRIREARIDRPDRTLWTWESPDSVKKGWSSKRPSTSVKYSIKWHVDFKFTFDIGGIDPRCSGRTDKGA